MHVRMRLVPNRLAHLACKAKYSVTDQSVPRCVARLAGLSRKAPCTHAPCTSLASLRRMKLSPPHLQAGLAGAVEAGVVLDVHGGDAALPLLVLLQAAE